MRFFFFIFILWLVFNTDGQTISPIKKKIRTRTTYYSATNSKLRTVDSFSVDGLLIEKKKYDYEMIPTVKQGPVDPGPVKLLCKITYKYDSLGRCIYEEGNSFWCGTWRYLYEDSGRTILKQSYSELKKDWKNEDKYVLTAYGDTCKGFHYGNSQSENPNSGWRHDFSYEKGRVVNWKGYDLNSSAFKDSTGEKWNFSSERKCFYSSFSGPDSIVYFSDDHKKTGGINFTYDAGNRKIKQAGYSENRSSAYEWKYDLNGNCILIKYSVFFDGKCVEVKEWNRTFNEFGFIEKENSKNEKSAYRYYRYTYY